MALNSVVICKERAVAIGREQILVFRQSRWQISLKISKSWSFSNPLTSSKNWIYGADKDQKKKGRQYKIQMVENFCDR